MDNLKDLAHRRMDHHHLEEAAGAAEILFAANEWIAQAIPLDPADRPRAYQLKLGILFVSVSHATIGQEFSQVSGNLLSKLRARFGERRVLKIRTKSLTTP